MSYQATVLADSVSPEGIRLTTLWITHPRFILAEVNTHRMLSRNSNSSRAIPPERQIAAVRENPFVPETFNKRVKGMGVGEELDGHASSQSRASWIAASKTAADFAEQLVQYDCDKSRVNRLLEPFLWHSAVITATEWENFFALRDNPAAQPEFQIIASLMRTAIQTSTPEPLTPGEWHLPGVDIEEREDWLMQADDLNESGAYERAWEELKRVSAGRLARWTSYDKTEYEEFDSAIERCNKLIPSFHLSPLEHQATPFSREEWQVRFNLAQLMSMRLGVDPDITEHDVSQLAFCGNLQGWRQFRKQIPNEYNAGLAQEET